MHIDFVEIQNFRKLRSVRIDFAPETTLLVGANNSGKTSAMVALGHFLVNPKRFSLNDFTLSNWRAIHAIGEHWENPEGDSPAAICDLWDTVLPSLDLWLSVSEDELHHVNHLLPT